MYTLRKAFSKVLTSVFIRKINATRDSLPPRHSSSSADHVVMHLFFKILLCHVFFLITVSSISLRA